jgi:hypothetical protein
MPASLPHRLVLAALTVIAATSVVAANPIAPAAQLQTQPTAPEERPPPPPHNGGSVTWLPGQWRSTGIAGAEWQWEPGRYVAWPADRSATVIDPSQSTPNVSGWLEDEGR